MKYQSSMLAQCVELDFRPLLAGHINFDGIGGQKGRRCHGVMRHAMRVGIDETLQFTIVITGDPARSHITRRCQPRLAAVFMFQAMRHDLELDGNREAARHLGCQFGDADGVP
jgi:hypothetical protein